MKSTATFIIIFVHVFIIIAFPGFAPAARATAPWNPQSEKQQKPFFEVSFAESARKEAVTGRVYVAIARDDRRAPIHAAGSTGEPLFGRNVEALKPGEGAAFDNLIFGHPVQKISDIPEGDYWVQGFINIYTECKRADGHTVWVHLDQGEGQNFRRSPGNLFSKPQKIHFNPAGATPVRLVCDQVIPPIAPAKDTDLVKRIKIKSKILSDWWGAPIYLGATVLLPKDYDKHPDVVYPVNYEQGHFSPLPPGGFGFGRKFDQIWLAPDTPRFVYITFQHASPYYDDSYAVNSENNGPYGDAIIQELIPEIEKNFRVLREPRGRFLSGGSTGGWIALALQVFYPDFFGGCWASCPDPVDFRYHQIVNIYDDANAYFVDKGWTKIERPNERDVDGNIRSTMKDENWFELACGDRSRSGGQWDIWEATFSPCGPDGYPMRIWDKRTGAIDKAVASVWREKYDLRYILERDWARIGPKLAGKIHVYVGDEDTYYLNNAVLLLEAFLKTTKNPAYDGSVEFCRLKPHCWGPNATEHLNHFWKQLEKFPPAGVDLKQLRYQ